MSILDDLISVVREIEGTTGIEVIRATYPPEMRSQVTREQLLEILTDDDLSYPACVPELLGVGDSLGIYWKVPGEGDGNDLYGEFYLRTPLFFARSNLLPEILQVQEHSGIDLREVRELDTYAFNAGPIHALMRVVGQKLEDHIYVFNERDVFNSDLDCTTYLKTIVRTRGILYWQYLYCKDKKLQPFEVAALERGLNFLESTFEEDCTDLRQRLREARRTP
jgi:hypothetical protein